MRFWGMLMVAVLAAPAVQAKGTPEWKEAGNNFSPAVRQSLGVDAVVQVNLFLANTRKEFRIQDMSVKLTGITWSGQKGGDMPTLTYTLDDAGAVAVPLEGKGKDN